MKKLLLVIIIAAICLTLSLLAGSLNWFNQFVVTGVSYFLAGLIYRRSFPISRILYAIIAIVPFLAVYTRLVIENKQTHVFPIAFLPFLAISIGLLINSWYYNGMKTNKIIAFVLVFSSLILLLGYLGMPNWLAYTFSSKGHVTYPAPAIALQRSDGSVFNLNEQKGKILVLDLWNTGCGICYKKFPDFDHLKQKYASTPNIEFYAVNLLHRNEELNKVKRTTQAFPYTFENLHTDSLSSIQIKKQLNIDLVPTIVIINKDAEVVYKGNLNVEHYIFYDNINQKIMQELSMSHGNN